MGVSIIINEFWDTCLVHLTGHTVEWIISMFTGNLTYLNKPSVIISIRNLEKSRAWYLGSQTDNYHNSVRNLLVYKFVQARLTL